MKNQRKQSLQNKLIVSNIILISVIIVFIEVFVYAVTTQTQINDAVQLNNEQIMSITSAFDTAINAFKRQIDFITMNETMQDKFDVKPKNISQELIWKNSFRSDISVNSIMLDEIDSVYLYNLNGEIITYWQKRFNPNDEFLNSIDVNKTGEKDDVFSDNGAVTISMQNDKVTYNRKIIDTQNLDALAYITFVYNNEALRDSLGEIAENPDRFIAILNKNGKIISHNSPDANLLYSLSDEIDLLNAQNDSFVKTNTMGDVLISGAFNQTQDFKLISIATRDSLLRSADFSRLLILCVGFISILVGVFLQVLIARHTLQPVKQILNSINKIEKGDYTGKIEIKSNDEIGQMSQSFNHMVKQIDVLVNQNLRNEISYRDMQLMMLQTQIDPHFLYNTLECINCLAQLGRKDEVRKVTVSFSNLMKSLASGPKTVTIEQELEYTKDFLTIYKALLEEKLTYNIECDNLLLGENIPRLTIQPLVENAVLHGIKQSSKNGHVSVCIMPSLNGTLISVMDDGVGMPKEIVDSIIAYSKKEHTLQQQEKLGTGIKNVIDRLLLTYKDNVQFSIKSDEWGTSIDVCLPFENLNEEDDI